VDQAEDVAHDLVLWRARDDPANSRLRGLQ
jgi:hypothetical protein